MSKYDSIRTAAEMVQEVRMHGLSTAQEDLNRVADIFGRSNVEELVRLANDIGRNNENGEPDPKGSWSSNRQPTQGTFYSIISHIWSWEEVTRFWNLHTNPQHEELVEMREIRDKLTKDLNQLEGKLDASKAEVKAEHEARLAETSEKRKAQEEIDRLNGELHSKDMEIMELKARLYDLLVGKEGK